MESPYWSQSDSSPMDDIRDLFQMGQERTCRCDEDHVPPRVQELSDVGSWPCMRCGVVVPVQNILKDR